MFIQQHVYRHALRLSRPGQLRQRIRIILQRIQRAIGEFLHQLEELRYVRPDDRIRPQDMLCAAVRRHADLADCGALEAPNAHIQLHPDHLGHFVRFDMRPHALCAAGNADSLRRVLLNLVAIIDQRGRRNAVFIFKMIGDHAAPLILRI